MKIIFKHFIIIVAIFIAISLLFASFSPQTFQREKEIPFSQFAKELREGKIKEVKISANKVSLTYLDGEKALTFKEPGVSIFEQLKNYGLAKESFENVSFWVEKEKGTTLNWLFLLLTSILPLLFFIWFFWMIFKQAKVGAGQTFSFLKPPAKIFGQGKTPGEKVTFKDIADLKEAKEEVKEIVDFLKNPKKYLRMGARIPRGVLLIGAPGTGKTLMAKAIANEADVPFFSIVGSEFVELFVGVGSSRVRQLFREARKHKSAIIFIDEIDAIGKVRMPGIGGGHEEREQTLNQILAEMDGIERGEGLIVIGATNRPEQLDPALLRPGRFDRRIVFDLPDVQGREEILNLHSKGKPLALDVNLREIAERTPGFSGADLANLVNEAAILAARREKKQIYQEEFLEAIEKVLLGPERKSHLLTKKEKEISAFHETGHALIATFLPGAKKVRKISIVARGMAAGYTLALPKEERKIKTKSELLTEIAVLLGGYCAERLKFGEISTGAGDDLQKATLLARKLVTRYGMSRLGPVTFGKREVLPFLGLETETERNYSEKVAALIDKETERILKEAEKKTFKILKTKRKLLEKVAKTLIKKETIEKEEFEKLVSKKREKKEGKIRQKKKCKK